MEQKMRTLFKAAIVVFGAAGALSAAPAIAQPYDDGYYDNGYGDDEDYGYCDPQYGCPDDYYDQPLYYGQVYWGDEWYDGPIYYRDWGGRRQFWIHGGWRFTNQYRGGRFGPALGRSWYGQHRNEFRGLYNRGGNRGYNGGGYRGQQNGFGNRNYGNYRDYSQRGGQRSFGGSSNFQSQQQPQQNFNRGTNDWRSGWSNRQGFGQNGYGQRGVQQQQQQAAPQPQRSFGGGEQRGFGGGDRVTRGNFWQGRQNAQPQAAPAQQAAPQQAAPERSFGGRDGGGRGDRGGRGNRD
jgi:hypothetical protein